jgi:tripeptidyl-peptidase-1
VRFFSPPDSSYEAVKEWLTSAGIPPVTISRSMNKQWVQFDAPAGKVEDLLMADYHIYEHTDSGAQNVACEE